MQNIARKLFRSAIKQIAKSMTPEVSRRNTKTDRSPSYCLLSHFFEEFSNPIFIDYKERFREIEIASGLLFALLRVFFGWLLGHTLKPMPS